MKCICCNEVVGAVVHDGDEFIKNEEDAIFVTEKREFEEGKITYLRAENRMWNDGIVGNISAGYGSILDGNMYAIAICDECTKKRHLDGTIAYVGNYMSPEYYRKNEEEKARQIWRRYNQLDNLLEEKPDKS